MERQEEEAIEEPNHTSLEQFTFDAADQLEAPIEATEITDSARSLMLESTVRRLCSAGVDPNAPGIWIPLVIRLITRGLKQEEVILLGEGEEDQRESLRQILFNFIVADFQHR